MLHVCIAQNFKYIICLFTNKCSQRQLVFFFTFAPLTMHYIFLLSFAISHLSCKHTCDKVTFLHSFIHSYEKNWHWSRSWKQTNFIVIINVWLIEGFVYIGKKKRTEFMVEHCSFNHFLVLCIVCVCALSMKYDWKHIWFVSLLIGIKRSLAHWKISFVSGTISNFLLELYA